MRLYQCRQVCVLILLLYLKGVLCESRQAVVHVASSARVDYYLSYLICFTQLRRPVRLNNAHQCWRRTKMTFRKQNTSQLKGTVFTSSYVLFSSVFNAHHLPLHNY